MSYHLHKPLGCCLGLFKRRDEEVKLLAYQLTEVWILYPHDYRHGERLGNSSEITEEEATMILFQCRSPI